MISSLLLSVFFKIHFYLCFVYRYEFETSVRWIVNSTLNPSPCPVGLAADLIKDGKLVEVPAKGVS